MRIIGLCVAAAIFYGVVHDQVTARICIEYFTIGHPPVVGTESATVLGLVWGVLATWWVGLLLGIPLALVSARGPAPPRTAGSLVAPIARLLGLMAGAALVAGCIGHALASEGLVVLFEPLASRVPRERHVAFLSVGWAHGASYLVAFGGGAVLVWRVWRGRRAANGARR